MTFLPPHDLDSFQSPQEINRSLAASWSPLELGPTTAFSSRCGLGWDWLIPQQTRALHSQGTGLPRVRVLCYSCCPTGGNAIPACPRAADLALQVPLLQGSLPAPALGPQLQVAGGSQHLPAEPVTVPSLFAGAPSPAQTVSLEAETSLNLESICALVFGSGNELPFTQDKYPRQRPKESPASALAAGSDCIKLVTILNLSPCNLVGPFANPGWVFLRLY